MRKKIFFRTPPIAFVAFRENDIRAIRLVSENGNCVKVNIFFKVSGVTTEEIYRAAYLLSNGIMGSLKNALVQIMEEERFHNFYPDLLVDDSEGGVYAGSILKRNLVIKIKRMRPDLATKEMLVEAVVISFTPVPIISEEKTEMVAATEKAEV